MIIHDASQGTGVFAVARMDDDEFRAGVDLAKQLCRVDPVAEPNVVCHGKYPSERGSTRAIGRPAPAGARAGPPSQDASSVGGPARGRRASAHIDVDGYLTVNGASPATGLPPLGLPLELGRAPQFSTRRCPRR